MNFLPALKNWTLSMPSDWIFEGFHSSSFILHVTYKKELHIGGFQCRIHNSSMALDEPVRCVVLCFKLCVWSADLWTVQHCLYGKAIDLTGTWSVCANWYICDFIKCLNWNIYCGTYVLNLFTGTYFSIIWWTINKQNISYDVIKTS